MLPKYNLLDFFPDCMLPACPDICANGQPHQHILTHQQTILDCDTKYLYCQGGVGSAKSLAFAVKSVYLSLTIPRNRGVISRLHYDDLYDSSWREVKDCLQRLVDKEIIPAPVYSKKTQGDYSEIYLPWCESELKAIQGKNWSRGLGANHGWFWVDDAMESMEEFFVGTNTSAGLLSRLRLPHVHYNKSTFHSDTRTHGSLHGMVSSNPPPHGHWLHKLFGDKAGIHKLGEDTVTWTQVATSDNPFVGADYAKGLIAAQLQMGHSSNNIRRVIFGESIPAYAGVPVFPQFNHSKHVAPLKFKEDLPLLRSFDFGHDHPAVTFSNIYKCKYGTNHYFTLSEIADAFNLTVYKLYDDYVLPHTKSLYGKAKLILNAGDRAGQRVSSSNKDRRGDMKILQSEYHLPFKWRYMNLVPSLQYIRSLLEPRQPCKCGIELILISDKCPVLIGALEGGYRYPKQRNGPIGDKPVEDKYFADVACAWRYGAENYVKWGVPHTDQVALKQQLLTDQRKSSQYTLPSYNWIDASDHQMAQLILTDG